MFQRESDVETDSLGVRAVGAAIVVMVVECRARPRTLERAVTLARVTRVVISDRTFIAKDYVIEKLDHFRFCRTPHASLEGNILCTQATFSFASCLHGGNTNPNSELQLLVRSPHALQNSAY